MSPHEEIGKGELGDQRGVHAKTSIKYLFVSEFQGLEVITAHECQPFQTWACPEMGFSGFALSAISSQQRT
jgi:hypothetical protein